MPIRLSPILLAIMILVSPSFAADLQSGLTNLDQGNYEAAESQLSPLVEQGNAKAQYALGIIYLNGFLEEPKTGTATQLIRRAAEQGYLPAQTELARMYRTGEGVPQNFAKMADWYSRAAEQGDVGAQLFLADSFAYGYGVDRDLVKAYMWYEIAIQYWGPLAVRARDIIGGQMKPEDIAQAVTLAGNWLHERNR